MPARTPTRPLARFLPWFFAALVLASGAVPLGVILRDRAAAPSPLPLAWELPAFSLTNRDGRPIALADLAGAPWVADFIFTRCGGICPRMTAALASLAGGFPRGVRVRRVSISVDPEFDTPQVLSRYAESMGADDPDWLFLSGEREAIHRLCREGFRLAVGEAQAAGGAGEPILHSSKFVLVDAAGQIRGLYDGLETAGRERLLADLAVLAGEPRPGRR